MRRKKKRDTDIYDAVASNIKKYRMAVDITQEELANMTLYTPEYIRRIESPRRKGGFSIETTYIIAKTLGIHISELFKKESGLSNKSV